LIAGLVVSSLALAPAIAVVQYVKLGAGNTEASATAIAGDLHDSFTLHVENMDSTSTAGAIEGYANTGAGGAAIRATNAGSGYAVDAHGTRALRVDGILSLKRSGVIAVKKNKSYATISVPSGGLTSASSFMATFQSDAGAGVAVAYAVKRSPSLFRVYFTKKTAKSTKLGWVVID